jgi:hypothetical protein
VCDFELRIFVGRTIDIKCVESVNVSIECNYAVKVSEDKKRTTETHLKGQGRHKLEKIRLILTTGLLS